MTQNPQNNNAENMACVPGFCNNIPIAAFGQYLGSS